MSKAAAQVVVGRAALETIRRGHPWVWRRAVSRADPRLDAGEEVVLVGPGGRTLGFGVWDPESPIAVRVWGSGDGRVDEHLFASRLERAFAIRAGLFGDGGTTAYRLVNGEGDRAPGLVVDRYGHVAVLKADGAAAMTLVHRFARVLETPLRAIGVSCLVWRKGGKREQAQSETLFGHEPPQTVTVSELGIPFVVDLARGQKTGAFLDQRDNRQRVGRMGQGRTVLNLFSYAGGFSVHAARGGASRVTSVDVAAGAHATAQESFRTAGVSVERHEFVTADAFRFLAEAKARGRLWDLVISDPPSFAPSEKALPRALTAYRSLHRACADVLAPDGILCLASCSSHVDTSSFASTLDDVALGRSDLRLLALHGAPPDHPTLPAWPEGRYLKFAILA